MVHKKQGKHFGKKVIIAVPVIGIFIFLGTNFPFSGLFMEYFNLKESFSKISLEKELRHIPTPPEVKAVYMTSWTAAEKGLRERIIKLVENTELNSIVIDIKDSTGKISFPMADYKIQQIGSSENRIKDIGDLIKELHNKNIYIIGRISVFQDSYLARKRPDIAVKKNDSVSVWKDYKGISWLDTCSKEVWEYTIAIAREAEAMGFDELNFDYVRFPSDGNINDMKHLNCDPKLTKSDQLESFFYYLKKGLNDLSVPLSVDLFGMAMTNTDDLNIGQVLERTEPYFDYIAPMVYPSHYPRGYNNYQNPAAMPYEIVKAAMDAASFRLTAASSTPHKLRPWLQDFDLGADYNAAMVRKQKQAVYDAGLNSWMLWNASSKYTADALDTGNEEL